MSKIEWCDITWNPAWGCLNNCEYCYARKMAMRIHRMVARKEVKLRGDAPGLYDNLLYRLKNFIPTFLESNFLKALPKKPSRIFVNSMSDICYWKPEWMESTLAKIELYPQHTFMFLTKFPEVYIDNKITDFHFPDNCMLGFTATNQKEFEEGNDILVNLNPMFLNFVSIEPIHEKINIKYLFGDWLIVGAETGNRKNKIIPKKEWIEEFSNIDIPLFMKDNLRPYYDGKFRQEHIK